jgi:hypothetical protein
VFCSRVFLFQRSDDQQFLYETTVEAKVNDVIKEMCEIHNLRLRVHRLFLEGGELAEFGPAREPSKVGIDDYKVKDSEKSAWFKEDPTGRRTGNGTPKRPFCQGNFPFVYVFEGYWNRHKSTRA